MRRGAGVLGLTAAAVAGLAASIFVTAGWAHPVAKHAKRAKVVHVTVVAREFSFKLSTRSIPVGTVVFKVENKGKISHDFKIDGKKTKILNPGQTALLTVHFKKKGRYSYVCTVLGHAKLGMRGVLGVGVKPGAPTPTPTTPPPTTTPPPPTTAPTGTVGNATSTIHVSMFEYGFKLDTSTVPSGKVTFVITNNGQQVHNFDILTVHAGNYLNPGQTETWTVSLAPRTYTYECDVPYHAQEGMEGQFTVTG